MGRSAMGMLWLLLAQLAPAAAAGPCYSRVSAMVPEPAAGDALWTTVEAGGSPAAAESETRATEVFERARPMPRFALPGPGRLGLSVARRMVFRSLNHTSRPASERAPPFVLNSC